MALSEAENERLGILLENLSTVRAKLNPRAQEFLDSQIQRHDQYGDRMFVSPKQLDWLLNLHSQHCPGVALPSGDADDHDGDDGSNDDDMDDAIPF